jgi:hypothetical protein
VELALTTAFQEYQGTSGGEVVDGQNGLDTIFPEAAMSGVDGSKY